jgi:hypothetical protein
VPHMTTKIGSMTRRRWTLRLASLAAAVAICSARLATAQQTSWSVSSAADLTTALAGAYGNNVTNPSLLNTITLTGSISGSSQWIVNANVNIVGNGYTINMQTADRAFFIAGGNVAINNLTIQNGNATGGAAMGGGAGAGLGGAIFVGGGTYNGGFDPMAGTTPVFTGISTPNVTLSGVGFLNNSAVGGSSGIGSLSTGGGGMGGAGTSGGSQSGGGGGGFGVGANGGGQSQAGAAGAFVNISGANTSGGAGGNGGDTDGGAGGANGGGGGGGGETSFFGHPGSGGGGGLGGARGFFVNDEPPNNGGNGGFGGGGGQSADAYDSGGNGGFGGGGGSSASGNGGNGGFGGGGGAGFLSGGNGGFGASDATSPGGTGNDSFGGGGLGAGGAIFVMAGASLTVQDVDFSGSSVTGGSGGNGNNGSAYGTDLFLGANVNFNVSSNLTVNSLGGAGNLADPNVAANDPNAQGGIIKTGAGNLTLTGTSYYTGVTTVNSGTLTLAAGAQERGTTLVTVGQNNGDNATLVLGSSANLTLGGFDGSNGTDAPVMIAQNAGSTGTIVIGNGAGSSGAIVNARTFTGGAGTAKVQFTQQYAAGSPSVTTQPFSTTLTGSLQVVQSGVGSTVLQPLYGANTFTGGVVVNSGTLLLGNTSALPAASDITVNGGTFDIGSFGGTAGALTVNGGTVTSLKLAPLVFNPSGTNIGTAQVPATGSYVITAAGGQGGAALNFNGTVTSPGGNGGLISGLFTLNAGSNVAVIVGMAGLSGTVGPPGPDFVPAAVAGGGGGGGTFVFLGQDQSSVAPTLLLAAGGGGGGGIVGGSPGGGAAGAGGGGAGGDNYAASAQGGGGGGGLNGSGAFGQSDGISIGGEGGKQIVREVSPVYFVFSGKGGKGEKTMDPHLFGDLHGGDGGFGGGGGGGTGSFGAWSIDIGYDPTYGGGGGGGGYTGGVGGGGGTFGENGELIGGGPAAGGTSFAAGTFTNVTETPGGNTQSNGYATLQYVSPTLSPTLVTAYSGVIDVAIGGSGGLSQIGSGTTTITAGSSFTGATLVSAGTLLLDAAGSLGGTPTVEVTANAVLVLGQSATINDSATLQLAGGVLQTGTSLSETLGALNVTGGASIIDFLGTASTLNFASLSLDGSLAIWNYAGANDFLTIATGTATGSLSQITFFSDSGSTFLGYGGFTGTQLVPVAVPEPSTVAMALAAIACGGWSLRRRTRRETR